jgi:hypothetical protein
MFKTAVSRIPQRLWRTICAPSRPSLPDVGEALRDALSGSVMSRLPRAGRVAIGAGSRGLSNLAALIRGLVEQVRAAGAEPFVVPSMGSHGGATAEGQLQVLKSLGISEQAIGAPILATMEVQQVGQLPDGTAVCIDRNAAQADAIIALNRVKAHTDFSGPFESGIMKMLAVGFGKEVMARRLHAGGTSGLRELIPESGQTILRSAPVSFCVAVLENSRGRTCQIEALLPDEVKSREPQLLLEAKRLGPGLPFEQADVLVVGQMGKDVSGTGMDPHVIGRRKIEGEPEPESPRVKVLVVLSLSAGSAGNAIGLGLADLTTRRLVDAVDWKATWHNGLVSGFLERAKMPIVLDSDLEALETACDLLTPRRPDELRLGLIKNTLDPGELLASDALADELQSKQGVEIWPDPVELSFDAQGNLIWPEHQ